MSAPAIIPFASDLATRIRAEHDAAQSAMRSAVGHAVEAGKLLMEAKKSVPHGGWEAWVRDSCGFSERTAQGYMRLARLAPDEAQRVALLSLRDALKALAEPKSEPAPLPWSGETSWFTPTEIVEAARQVLGRIDIDPASCAKAQEVIQAGLFFTEAENGLAQKWRGRVWLINPTRICPTCLLREIRCQARRVYSREISNDGRGCRRSRRRGRSRSRRR
jgi:hypothetical protein